MPRRRRTEVCSSSSAGLHRDEQLRCKTARGYFVVGDWQRGCPVKEASGGLMAVKKVRESMNLGQVGWHFVCGQPKADV